MKVLLVDVRPPLGPGDDRFTSCSAVGTGSARTSAWLKIEKIAALAPLPTANVRTMTAVKPGARRSARKAYRQSWAIGAPGHGGRPFDVNCTDGNRDQLMTLLRRSPFKVARIEDDPDAFGLRPEAVRSCAEALFNRQSLLISGERGIGKSSLANQFKTIYEGTTTLLERSGISVLFPSYLCGYTFCTSDTSLADVCASIVYNLESACLLLRSTTLKSTKIRIHIRSQDL